MKFLESKSLNVLILVERIIFALAFLFLATGEMLHLNAFIQNGIDIGLPSAHLICTSVVVITILFSLCILVGFLWKTACFGLIFVSLFSGFFFFAGHINKVNIIGVLFALTILINFIIIGCGKISLEYFLQTRRIKQNKRILFR